MSNAVMMALKSAIGQGTRFTLTQGSDPHVVVLEVTGGVASTSLKLPFNWIKDNDEPDVSGFKWESNAYTAGLLVSAVEGMPEDADPQILVNTSLWSGGGLVLSGEWEVKKGRAKEGKKHFRNFMFDCAVLGAE